MAVSSSTAVPSNNYQCYDVFLNHRGPDSKETFARSLYIRLLQKGLRPFLDKHEMQPGYNFSSQIEHAIRTASVHVAILSPRYAESSWCLDELVMMLESKAPVIPVFYRVKPAEVRWTQGKQGNYAQALQNLAKKRTHEGTMRYDSNTIEKWRNALSQAADNSGFELEVCNGQELFSSELEELPSMETLVSLEDFKAVECVKLKSIRGLEQATKLRVLIVFGCSELEELPSMETLVSLEELWTNRCVKLKSIRGLEQATKLRDLNVSGCSELEELPSMETLVSLEDFRAVECVKLKSIRGLEQATKLRVLNVIGCSELEELPRMETLVSLEELHTDICVKLKSIRGLEQATKLRVLIVSGCSELEELPSMETLVSLEELWTSGCVKLKSIRGLSQLTQFRRLSVRGCSDLELVEGVEHMSLEKLDVCRCPKLHCEVWE